MVGANVLDVADTDVRVLLELNDEIGNFLEAADAGEQPLPAATVERCRQPVDLDHDVGPADERVSSPDGLAELTAALAVMRD